MFKVGLENYTVLGKHGAYDFEHEYEQPFVVSIWVELNHNQFDDDLFVELGYHCYWYSAEKKGYSGVAILCKKKPIKVTYGIKNSLIDSEARVLKIEYENLGIYSVYFPSGSSGPIRQEFNMFFLNKFMNYIKNETQTALISGDFNICHKSIDIHDPIRNKNSSGFLEVERKWVTNFLKSGFVK